ncbi:MAG: Re/Si-specific NAD(P)(+) transhydrogenase subunit alpha [Planctomycetota bacterium]|nr:Re/Si-specific NAD(P)(+) transhydrogenase subunit alpha [Planctomycetota bacterium]
MIIGIPAESYPGESRVAATPDSVKKLIKLGYTVQVEQGSGQSASYPDDAYAQAGAAVVDGSQIWNESKIIFKVRAPNDPELGKLKANPNNPALASFIWPAQNENLLNSLADAGVSTLAMDCVPRISRAQKLDALSSMANIAGYRAVIEAANSFGSFFTGQITAAGKVPPAKVMVIGAGVAGLAAIGAARGLGAIVRAFDTRPAVKDQVKSMGADFLELDFEEDGEGSGGYAKVMSKAFIEAEMALFAEQAREVDIIVTTALIPGKAAPTLITEAMVKSMKPGSVIVDLAAEQGGNCELTEPNEKVVKHHVTIIGYTDFPSRLPTQSSALYSNNLVNLITDMTPGKEGQLEFDLEDEVLIGCLITHGGEVRWPPPQKDTPPSTAEKPKEVPPAPVETPSSSGSRTNSLMMLAMTVLAGVGLLLMGLVVPGPFVSHLTVFILSCFIGWQVIWNVNPALHTPLMSVTNAISGIIVIGAIAQIFNSSLLIMILATIGILIATINIVGGFWVTNRMLDMFRKQD